MSRLSGLHLPSDPGTDRQVATALLIVLALWLVLLTRLFYLQVVEGDRYRISAERNSVRTHRVKATRGIIFDRNGTILVGARPSFDVLVVPHESPDLDRTLTRIALLADRDADEIRERYGSPEGRARFQTLRIVRDLERDALSRVEVRLWALPGVLTEVTPVREYRFGDSAAHVLGQLGEISPEELRSRAYHGYRRGDVIGKLGVEKLVDRELRGRDGGRNVLVDAHGRALELLGQIEPQRGQNVRLTLDHRLQQVAESALDESGRSGAVVALDPRNGEVLVLASRPAFDANLFAIGVGHEDWAALNSNPDKPLLNRALAGQYAPGSVYKVVTLIAGLEEGVIAPGYDVTCTGSFRLGRRRYRCWKKKGHGVVDAHRALVESCDVFFYHVGTQLGVDRLAAYAKKLGLGQPTGIEIEAEAAGLVPTRDWKQKARSERWLKGETVSLAIGQGFNLWTPMQMAALYAAIGMGGQRSRPFVIQRVEDPRGRVLRENRPQSLPPVAVAPETFERVKRALEGAVHERHGTGYAMRRLPGGVRAAGKTGTAQVVGMAPGAQKGKSETPIRFRDNAWFVTYLPSDQPRIVIAVLVEHGGHGSSAAAPIAARIARTFLENEAEAYARR